MVDGHAFGVHSASMWLNAWIGALTGRTDFVQSAFLVQRTGRLTDAGIAVRVGRAIGRQSAWHWQWSTADVNVDRFAAIPRTTIAEGDVIDGRAIGIRSTYEAFANVSTLRTIRILDAFSAGRTIGIRLTFECQATTFIVRIANVSGAASAMEGALVVRAQGAGAAWGIATEINGRALRVRVAAEAGLAVANWTMIFGRAQCISTACLTLLARQFAQLLVAEFVRWAADVGFAFDATAIALRVTSESSLTRAQCVMIARCAFGIPTAQHTTFARISALRATV